MSDSEISIEDPYSGTHTDSDEDFIPENNRNSRLNLNSELFGSSSDTDSPREVYNNAEEQPGTSHEKQIGRKRLQRKSLWSRNIRKAKRTQGKSYINSANSLVAEKKIGENCNCRNKCFDKIGEVGCNQIFTNFYGIPSKNLQDAYLYGGIRRKLVERKRPRSGDRSEKISTYFYMVRQNGQDIKICKKAYLSLDGITKSRLERLQKHLSNKNGTPPMDGTQDYFLNFKDHLQRFFLKNPATKNNKFSISKYRILRYEKDCSRTLVKCSESVGLPLLISFDVRNKKILEPISLPCADQKWFLSRRLLKKNNFQHVMTLAKNYVPPCDLWFYNEIEEYHKSYEAPDKDTSMSEYGDDE